MLDKNSKIYVAGHNGMVGSACWRALIKAGYSNLIGKSSKELDLRNQSDVYDFLSEEKPIVIIDAAAKVGGILANSNYPYEFLMDNMLIQNNLIQAAHKLDIPKFIFLGSSCIYPKLASQPMQESCLLSGPLEPTNEWYAIAKISGVKLIEALRKEYHRDYIALMPTNLYGPEDNFDLNSSHVLPAMLRKFYEAKINNDSDVTLWGTGEPQREFLHVDDMANAVVFVLENELQDFIYNIGTGTDISIKNLALLIQKVVGHQGNILWDETKPNGTPRKLMNVSKINQAGWSSKIELEQGIISTFYWFKANLESLKEIRIRK